MNLDLPPNPTTLKSILTPSYVLWKQDALSLLETLPANSIDLILTDPPYESLEKHRSHGTTTRLKVSKSSSNEWFTVFPNSKFLELFTQFYRVLRNNSHFYLHCDAETMFVAKPIAEAVGFKFWKPIVWDKQKIGMGYHYRARCEYILFFEKGKRKLRDLGIPDVLSFPRLKNHYPTQKPVELDEVFVLQSTKPGEMVLDTFMGAGTVGVAALKNGRQFCGCDTSENAMQIANRRIQGAARGEADSLLEVEPALEDDEL